MLDTLEIYFFSELVFFNEEIPIKDDENKNNKMITEGLIEKFEGRKPFIQINTFCPISVQVIAKCRTIAVRKTIKLVFSAFFIFNFLPCLF